MSWFRSEVRRSAFVTKVIRSCSREAGRELVRFGTKRDSSPACCLLLITFRQYVTEIPGQDLLKAG
jgi:hypothetical protein